MGDFVVGDLSSYIMAIKVKHVGPIVTLPSPPSLLLSSLFSPSLLLTPILSPSPSLAVYLSPLVVYLSVIHSPPLSAHVLGSKPQTRD